MEVTKDEAFFAIVLAVVCCMALAVPALAQGMEPATPYFSHIQFYTGNMQINNGVAEVSGTLRISRGDACEIVATIEQDVDGSSTHGNSKGKSGRLGNAKARDSKADLMGLGQRVVFLRINRHR